LDSVAWLIGVLAIAGIEYHSVQNDLLAAVKSPYSSLEQSGHEVPPPPPGFVIDSQPDPSAKPGGWHVIGQQTFLTNCDVKDKFVSCSPQFVNLALLAFGPVAIGWALVSLMAYAIMWIRAGFREDQT